MEHSRYIESRHWPCKAVAHLGQLPLRRAHGAPGGRKVAQDSRHTMVRGRITAAGGLSLAGARGSLAGPISSGNIRCFVRGDRSPGVPRLFHPWVPGLDEASGSRGGRLLLGPT